MPRDMPQRAIAVASLGGALALFAFVMVVEAAAARRNDRAAARFPAGEVNTMKGLRK